MNKINNMEFSMEFKFNDGGRSEAGFKGKTGDCGVRAIAIVTGKPYKEVYNQVNHICKSEKPSKTRRGKSSARTGIHKHTFKKIMEFYGWEWVPTMFVGQGCKVHLTPEELPSGNIICNVSRHYVAVIDGVINDIQNCSREGRRCVYGYSCLCK